MNPALLRALATLIAGLHVPVSLGMPLGQAGESYRQVRDLIGDFGWSSADEIEARLRETLGQEAQS
jgi:hypothetical protein